MSTTAPPLECTILREKISPTASGIYYDYIITAAKSTPCFPLRRMHARVLHSAFTRESNTYGADISAVHSTYFRQNENHIGVTGSDVILEESSRFEACLEAVFPVIYFASVSNPLCFGSPRARKFCFSLWARHCTSSADVGEMQHQLAKCNAEPIG